MLNWALFEDPCATFHRTPEGRYMRFCLLVFIGLDGVGD